MFKIILALELKEPIIESFDVTQAVTFLQHKMDLTQEFRKLCSKLSKPTSKNKETRLPPLLLVKVNAAHDSIRSFESIIDGIFVSYVGYHRHLHLSGNYCFNDTDRNEFKKEVLTFLSASAKTIQQLSGELDEKVFPISNFSQTQFYQIIISQLMQLLNALSKRWELMQREYALHNVKPSRLFAHIYLSSSSSDKGYTFDDHMNTISDTPAEAKSSSLTSKTSKNTTVLTSKPSTYKEEAENQQFVQRYLDEIAPAKKLQEYQVIASQQKQLLFQETKLLQQRYSTDYEESSKLEKTVHNISNLVVEFASMIEGQSHAVEDIGEIAKEVTESVKSADMELLKTLERSQSQQWNMNILIIILSFLLLLLHVLTP